MDIVSFRLVLFSCCLLATVAYASQQFDLGTCGCMCSNPSPADLAIPQRQPFYQRAKKDFFLNIRGPVGSVGENGAIGEIGPRGEVGIPGLRGMPSPDLLARKKNTPISCLDVLNKAGSEAKASGIYAIRTPNNKNELEVYCDMNTNGGGWQLVASVHENNVRGECTTGDNWSGVQGPNGQPTGSWQNYATFGQVDSATSDDYKSAAYYDSEASNVMIWHVPNNRRVSEWNASAVLQYYTENNFLTKFGGSLQTLYSKHYPIPSSFESAAVKDSTDFERYTESLNSTSEEIVSLVPDYYHHTDFETRMSLHHPMMRDRAGIYFGVDDNYNRLNLEDPTPYFDIENGVEGYTQMSGPFMTMMWINNPRGRAEKFSYKLLTPIEAAESINDLGGPVRTSSNTHDDTVMVGDVTCVYFHKNLHAEGGPGSASISQLIFSCSSTRWTSTAGTFSHGLGTDRISGLGYAPPGMDDTVTSYVVSTSGSPRNVLMGMFVFPQDHSDRRGPGPRRHPDYTDTYGFTPPPPYSTGRPPYASRDRESPSGHRMTHDEADEIMRTFAASLVRFDGGAFACNPGLDGLAVPVKFQKGNPQALVGSEWVEDTNEPITPGYLQFRTMGFSGTPYAMCPGVKFDACNPNKYCIGAAPVQYHSYSRSINGTQLIRTTQEHCGDFASAIGPTNSTVEPAGFLGSTILIFTR